MEPPASPPSDNLPVPSARPEPVEGVVICDDRFHDCRCVLEYGHYPDTPHQCSDICTGSWAYDDNGDPIIVTMAGPRVAGGSTMFYDTESWVFDTMEIAKMLAGIRARMYESAERQTRAFTGIAFSAKLAKEQYDRMFFGIRDVSRMFGVNSRMVADRRFLQYERDVARAARRSKAADTSRKKRRHGRR